MAARLVLVRPDIHVVEPRARGGGIQVLDDAPSNQTRISVDDDGTVTIDTGETDAEPDKPANFDDNLAEAIDSGALAHLAQMLLEGIEADKDSRRDWEDTANIAARYLGVKLEEPSAAAGADGTVSKAIATCLLEAVVKSWSTARAELLPVGGPVKVKRDDMPVPTPIVDPGAEPPVNRDELANALEQDLNWFLTVGDREYYPDYSKMLFARALIGCAFRKVFRCPLRRRPTSVWVKAQNLIISNDCTHLSGAGRITEVIRLRQSQMRRMQRAGYYLDIGLVQPTGEVTDTEEADAEIEGIAAATSLPADNEHLVYECSCEIDSALVPGLETLDRDEARRTPGYPMPYRVSIDLDSRAVLEIRRDWKAGDDQHRRRRRYIKYGFIPGLGFYDYGLIHLVGNQTLAASMIQRATVDAALFANFPGGMYLQGVGTREKTTVFRPNPGEWIGVNGGGAAKIGDVFMPMPYKDPSAEAMALGDKIEASVKRLAGVVDIPVPEGRAGDAPVGTMMSFIEAVSQVPGAVHKDDHAAQAEEFDLLRELFAEEPEALWRGNKTPAREWAVAEELMAPDLVPAADPNTPSALHRLMKLQALIQMGGLPQFGGIADNRAIYQAAVELLGAGAATDFTLPVQQPSPPPPDPRIVAAQIKAQSQSASDAAKLQIADATGQQKTAELAQEGEQREQDRDSAETRAAMSLEAAKVKAGADAANSAADRQTDAGIAGAQLVQKHAQHLNELGLAAAGQAQSAQQNQGGEE